MQGRIDRLYHYPIKGLSPQSLTTVVLNAGEGFPGDRNFGFARHDSGFDSADPRPLPKDRFLMLARDARLAGLDSHFDSATRHLTIRDAGREVLSADLGAKAGIAAAEGFFAAMFGMTPDQSPRFVHAAPHRFTDVSVVSSQMMNAVSLINLASVRALEEKTGLAIAPLRFRANIFFDGWPPFAEFDLLGQEITVGGIAMRLLIRTRRCTATEVNPATAERDIEVPRLLHQHFGHADMGVYAEVLASGTLSSGDLVQA
ncbi:MAG: MOSC domain-containing protein [Cypionkella sp.]